MKVGFDCLHSDRSSALFFDLLVLIVHSFDLLIPSVNPFVIAIELVKAGNIAHNLSIGVLKSFLKTTSKFFQENLISFLQGCNNTYT